MNLLINNCPAADNLIRIGEEKYQKNSQRLFSKLKISFFDFFAHEFGGKLI